MELRPKITLLLVGVVAASVGLNYVIQRVGVLPSFRALEREDAMEDWQRCVNAVERDLDALSQLCFDWAAWDDTYRYVQGFFPEFYEGNLANDEWFVDQHMDVLYVCRPDGTVHWRHVAELDEGVPVELSWLPGDRVPRDHPLMQVTSSKESRVDGVVNTELGVVMFSAHPILTSEYEGPLAGVLIFGRRLSEERVAELGEQTGVKFGVFEASDPTLTETDRAAMAESAVSGTAVEQLIDSGRLAVRGVLHDLDDEPGVLIRTEGERTISQHGESSLIFATWSLVVAGLLTLMALLIATRRMVVEPLTRLTEHATRVGESGHLHERLQLTRSDELGTLARSFDRMLDHLDESRANTVEMSRRAGKAEVAAGVLHNVGNALTNVCVLAETLDDRFARSRASGLGRVSTLLNEHRDDLPAFFSAGSPGTKLPEYVRQLASQLETESGEIREDLDGLREGLQHVKSIVAAHQGLARSSNFTEVTNPAEVVRGSLQLLDASFDRHGVTVEVEGEDEDETLIRCDRSKLSQVLVNLLKNAEQCLIGSRTREPRVVVRIARADLGTVAIEVSDNGPGVPPEHLEKLFRKGFSTKAEGQGIGLHYSWLAVREMRGTLSYTPDASTGGATFRIELPEHTGMERTAA